LPRWSLVLIIPAAAFLLLIGVSVIDEASSSGAVSRNVRLGDDIIGGMSEAELTIYVEGVADRYANIPVTVQTPDGEIETTTEALGLVVDVETTVANALAAGSSGSPVTLPFRWVGSLVSGPTTDVSFMVDAASINEDIFADLGQNPVEPSLAMTDGVLTVEAGSDGSGIDIDSLLAALPGAAATGGYPLRAEIAYTTVSPIRSLQDVETLRDELRLLLANGLQVNAGELEVLIAPAMLESWMIVSDQPEGLTWELDTELVLADLEILLTDETAGSGTAEFTVVDGEVSIVSSEGGEVCCDESATDSVDAGIRSASTAPVSLPLRESLPEEALLAAESLGIVELVGEFTTNHKCCEGRVKNIQRMAAIVQGYVIPPGEEFSINGFVGRRTAEKGFVSAGVISNGVFASDIGGGVSQFATTLFNAAFFAGLDYGEYQSHSIYISRYPYGREATVNYEHPDLVIKNTTPYGVLIWPTWTGTSITVSLYSTKYAVVEETGQVTSASGKCTVVTTKRQRTYPDGSVVDDSVFARYRPGQGLDCAGNSTDPNKPTTTTVDPNATTTVDPNATTTVDPNATTTVAPPTTAAPTTAAPTTAPPTTAAPTTAPPTTAAAPTTTTP
jgi:vancomycin resistance protein YoaR